MSENLTQASVQWRNRPLDERHWTLKSLHESTLTRHNASVTSRLRLYKPAV